MEVSLWISIKTTEWLCTCYNVIDYAKSIHTVINHHLHSHNLTRNWLERRDLEQRSTPVSWRGTTDQFKVSTIKLRRGQIWHVYNFREYAGPLFQKVSPQEWTTPLCKSSLSSETQRNRGVKDSISDDSACAANKTHAWQLGNTGMSTWHPENKMAWYHRNLQQHIAFRHSLKSPWKLKQNLELINEATDSASHQEFMPLCVNFLLYNPNGFMVLVMRLELSWKVNPEIYF